MIAGILEIQMMANLSRLSDDMRKAERVVSGSMDKVEKSIAHAKSAMQSLGMGLSIGLIADQLRRTVDTYTKLDAQLRLSTKSQQSYNTALADIRRISQIAQADISGTTMLYTRLMNVMDGTGVSQKKLATVTETVTFGLKAYGATSAEAASAALQLSQAMGANRLGGEEFRAVMEAMPNVMKVLAKSMGVGIGELRNLSIAGKITAAEMIKAWGDPAIAEQFKQYALRAQTITGSMTNVRNELTLLVGEFAKASGFTGGTIAAFNAMAAAVRVLAQYIGELVILLSAWAALRIVQMLYGYVGALMAQRAAALAAAQAELVRVNMTYGASAVTVTAARASVAYAAANTTLGGSLLILGQRMAAFVKANAAALAILSLGVAALALKRDFDAAIDSVGKFQTKIRAMEVDALRAARQLEVANVASMKAGIFSGFNERDILFAERRIRMMDAQIIAAEKLAKTEVTLPTGGGKPGKEHQSRMLQIAQELQAQTDADAVKMTHSERVSLAWAQLKRADKTEQEALNYVVAQQAAIELDNLEAARKAEAEWIKIRDRIADSVTKGIVDGARAEDVLKQMFRDMVLEPSVKLMVTAGVDWIASMLGNTTATTTLVSSNAALTAALNANTAAQGGNAAGSTGSAASGAGMSIMTMLGYAAAAYIVYKVGMGFFGRGGNNALGPATYEGSFSRGGNFQGGTRQGYKSESGAFTGGTQYSSVLTGMTPDQIRAINKTIVGLQRTFNDLGSAIGDLSIRTRDWSASFSGATDLNAALADSMANSLIPALEKFRLTGENLAQTAERLTDVFTTTNTFILALGVSSKEAFGSLGIASADARQALIDAAGGVDAFNQKAGSFIQNFLTDAQKLQPALDAVGRTFAELGISGISTNEQFAALVASELKLGHYDVVDQLLSVGDAFNAITSSAKATQDQLLGMLKTSSFETLVSYQRARGQTIGTGAGTQIDQAVLDASTQLPEESAANESAARNARKEAVAAWLAHPSFASLPSWLYDSPYNMPHFNRQIHNGTAYIAQVQAIYDSLPAFASGGDHMGGLRLVGENGPELEATGPSRIYTAGQTASMLAGNGGSDTADEIRKLRQEAAAHAIALNTATQKLAKITDRWDIQGLPPERIAA